MKGRYLFAFAGVALTVIATFNIANAGLSHTCFFTSVASGSGFGSADPSVPWFPSDTTVDVYYSSYQVGMTDYRPYAATRVTEAQFQQAVIKAVGVWNEQSGARIRLRYQGPKFASVLTCDQSRGEQCAVLIVGDVTTCAPGDDIDTADSYPGLDASHKYKQGTIIFHQSNKAGYPCHTIPWTTTTAGEDIDIVRALVHELGHTVFAIGHPSNPTSSTDDCTEVDPSGHLLISVMNGLNNNEERNLKPWDKEVAQLRYGTRATTGKLMKAYPASSTAWYGAAQVTGTSTIRPLYRYGSMTQGYDTRMISWIDGGTAVNAFGTGAGSTAEYYGGLSHTTTPMFGSEVGGPGAIASEPESYGTQLILSAMKVTPTGTDGYNDDQSMICWRTTSNLGSTWSAATCGASSGSSRVGSAVHGLTAAFNDVANSFVIAYVNTISGAYDVSVIVVPVSGSPVVSHFGFNSSIQPGIACVKGSNTCLLVFAVDDMIGSMGWFPITINTTTYVATQSSVVASTPVVMDDIPGLVYQAQDNTYRLARTEKSSAIYSYQMTVGAGTWSGTGDIYNNSLGTSQVSGAALSTRYMGVLFSKLYAWFEIYF